MSELEKRLRTARKAHRPIQTVTSQILGVLTAVLMLALGVIGGVFLVQGLVSGRTYPIGVVLGENSMVDRSTAPGAFWTMMGIFGIDFVVAPVLGIAQLREVVTDHKRKLAEKKREHSTH